MLQAWNVGNGAVLINYNWVRAEMPGHVHNLLTSPHVPVLVPNLVHLANAFYTPWLQEGVVQLAHVLVPQAHSEAVDVGAWRTLTG